MALLSSARIRYSLRVFLVVMAIAPPLLAYLLLPYFRATPRRTLHVAMTPRDMYTNSPSLLYVIRSDTFRTSFYDGAPFDSMDYLVAEGNKRCKLFFSSSLVGRVHFRPDQAMTPEMERRFQVVQEFVRERVIRDPSVSVEEYLNSHGGRILVELEDDDLPELVVLK